MKRKIIIVKGETFRSVALAILLGAITPAFSWHLLDWVAGDNIVDAQFYLPTTPLEIVSCGALTITGFPVIIFAATLNWLLQRYHQLGGAVPIFDTLTLHWQFNITISFAILLNILFFWFLLKWWFTLKQRTVSHLEHGRV